MSQSKPSQSARQVPATIPFPSQSAPRVNFPFIMVPDAIAADRELSPGAKILFGRIFSSTRRGRCYASNESLASKSGLSVIQVRRLLKTLEGRGLIVRDLNGKSRAEIRVVWACIKKMQGPDQNDATPCIGMMQVHASKGCTELESGVENLEDDFSLDREEIDPWTRRFFGNPPSS